MTHEVKRYVCDGGQMIVTKDRIPSQGLVFVGEKDYEALALQVSELKHQQKLLAEAIAKCVAAAGISKCDMPLTVPQLLMLADDLIGDIERQSDSASLAAAKNRVVGYSVGRRFGADELICSMDLSIEDWQQIKAECPWLVAQTVSEIDDAFKTQPADAENDIVDR